jgi:hypothetical protein
MVILVSILSQAALAQRWLRPPRLPLLDPGRKGSHAQRIHSPAPHRTAGTAERMMLVTLVTLERLNGRIARACTTIMGFKRHKCHPNEPLARSAKMPGRIGL